MINSSNTTPVAYFSSSLRVYYSLDTLSPRINDYSYVYVLPFICALGMSTNLASIVVALGIRPLDHMLKYVLINGLLDFLFLLTRLFLFIFRCGSLCPYGYTYASKFYEQYVYLFLGYTLITFQALFNLIMTIQRLCLFSKSQRKFLTNVNKWHYLAYSIISILLNAPQYLIPKEIVPFAVYYVRVDNVTALDGEVLFKRKDRDVFATSEFYQILLILLLIISNPGSYIAIGLLNVQVAVKFRQFIRKKQNMKQKKPPPHSGSRIEDELLV
jgi:hypothetical protein